MITFISRHLVNKIEDQIKEKINILKHDGFLYFDHIIEDPKKRINRVNRHNVFAQEQVLPVGWHYLSPLTLVKIYNNLKNNNFFIYKEIKGKSHKMRIKKRNDKSIRT
jgi:hypothetical protein